MCTEHSVQRPFFNFNGGIFMNKTNKYLNLALRCMIFLAFVMTIVLWAAAFNGFYETFKDSADELTKLTGKEQETKIIETFLSGVNKFGSAFTLYIVEVIILAVTAVLSLLTRYKTRVVSFVFRTLTLILTAFIFFEGIGIPNAFKKLSTYTDLTITAHDKDSLIASLTAGGVSSADVNSISDALANKEQIASTIMAYFIGPLFLFILVITSIHCLVKRNDPNNSAGSEE